MRRAILGTVVALMGTGCVAAPGAADDGALSPDITVLPSSTPYSQVTAGPVEALVPDGWSAVPAGGPHDGFIASPHPKAWARMDGATAGMTASWVDATRVGVPSDFYYLAATGPLLSRLTDSRRCNATSNEVYLDNRPTFADGAERSPGDYMARGEGTCRVRGHVTRWAYFVAAPGFGPVRRLGIPQSGLYVVVAVMRDSHRAPRILDRLISQASFGGSRVADFVAITGGVVSA